MLFSYVPIVKKQVSTLRKRRAKADGILSKLLYKCYFLTLEMLKSRSEPSGNDEPKRMAAYQNYCTNVIFLLCNC